MGAWGLDDVPALRTCVLRASYMPGWMRKRALKEVLREFGMYEYSI